MPYSPLPPCSAPGCPARAVSRGRCARHAQEAARRYREQHPDARPSAGARGYGAEWRDVRVAHLARSPWCQVCGRAGSVVDHIIPRAAGGTDDPSNLQTLCARCHGQKTARHDGGFGNKRRPRHGRPAETRDSVASKGIGDEKV
jgi:5-methylcytosine-specific restriction enzyme A